MTFSKILLLFTICFLFLIPLVSTAQHHHKSIPDRDSISLMQPLEIDSISVIPLYGQNCIRLNAKNYQFYGLIGELNVITDYDDSILYLMSFCDSNVTAKQYIHFRDTCISLYGPSSRISSIRPGHIIVEWDVISLDRNQHYLFGVEYDTRKKIFIFFKINKNVEEKSDNKKL